MKKIFKIISRGQITIPAKEKEEYTVFNATRDNRGKGIKAEDLVKILDELK